MEEKNDVVICCREVDIAGINSSVRKVYKFLELFDDMYAYFGDDT